ncbi:MAG TPA: hypothetical protein VFQ61_18045, partial [Polyangiaceae bacterium]|nr:hypothetical protein [Polyangiaceae bacterium]
MTDVQFLARCMLLTGTAMTQKLRYPRSLSRLFTSAVALVWVLPACSGSNTGPGAPPGTPGTPEDGNFVSAVPDSASGPTRGGVASGAGGGTGAPNPSTPPLATDGNTNGEAARAIEEADVIKIEGTRLYALSQYGGLSVIDISKRDQLRLLGRHKIAAMP